MGVPVFSYLEFEHALLLFLWECLVRVDGSFVAYVSILRDNYDFPGRNTMFRGGGRADRGRGRSGRGFNGGSRDWLPSWDNRGSWYDARNQGQMGDYGGMGFQIRNLSLVQGGGPSARLGPFKGGNHGLSSFGNPLWSNSLSRDLGDCFDSEPIPFQDGSMPEVEVQNAGVDKNAAILGLRRQSSGRRSYSDQEDF